MQFDMGVEDKLPFFVVLGDLLVLFDSLCQPQSCNAAVTRGKAKLVDEPSVTLSALPFYDSELDIQPREVRPKEAGEIPAHCGKTIR